MTSELIVSCSSAFIAILALGVAVWQGHLMRRHNRLSLRPHLTFRETISATNNPQFVLELQNNGIGPAIVGDFHILLDGKRETDFEAQTWLALLDLVGLHGQAQGAACGRGEFLAAGQSLRLVKYDSRPNLADIGALRKALQRLTVHIKYHSVYGDKYNADYEMQTSIFDCFKE